MRHRQCAADDAGDEEQGEHDHDEGDQQDAGDRENQANHEHAEGGQHQDLAKQAHDERAAE